jgi:hypothetical protein
MKLYLALFLLAAVVLVVQARAIGDEKEQEHGALWSQNQGHQGKGNVAGIDQARYRRELFNFEDSVEEKDAVSAPF